MKTLPLQLYVLLAASFIAAAPIDRSHYYHSVALEAHKAPGSYGHWVAHGKHFSFHILRLHASHAAYPAETTS